jgi:hypothetical protein
MRIALLILSSVLLLAGVAPYAYDVEKQKSKPRLVTWFNWTLLTGIASAAALADGQIASAVLTLANTAGTGLIVVLGWRSGSRQIGRLDVLCQIAVLLGLALWLIFNDPLIAIIASVTLDFMAGLPTFKHAWSRPHEETSLFFGLSALSAICALLALRAPHVSGMVYPIFLVASNVAVYGLILLRRHQVRKRRGATKSLSV